MDIIVNEATLARSPELLAFFGGSLDAKRPTAWVQYGYPTTVTFDMLKAAYDRGGAAHGAVHRLLDGCWQENPRIKRAGSEDETPWEKATAKLLKDVQAWRKLRDLDRRNMVGRYAALIYRVGDGLPLSEPMVRAKRLVDLVPLYEDQLKVTKWHEDQTAENYGQPAMFQYKTRPVAADADTQGRPETWIDVHPSRVQILAEGSVGDMFDGVPLLLAGFNDLIDIEKIKGGSAEGFLKNSSRTLHFKFDGQANLETLAKQADGTTPTVREVVEQRAQALNKNIDASVVTQGGDVTTLQTSVADPSKPFEVAANLFAASVRIPFTILFGQQTGRLASDEDKADMHARCKSRQTTELTPMLEQFITRMQTVGLIEAGEFEVEWEDLSEPTDEQRLGHGKTMAETNQIAFNGGAIEPVYDNNEIRKAAGYEERAAGGDEFKEDTPTPEEVAAAAALAGKGTKPAVTKPEAT